jgi:hypothetical protein
MDQMMPAPHAPNNSTRQSVPGAITPAADAPALAVQVVQQDVWEQPWNGAAAPSPDQTRTVGDRVLIRQGRRPIPALVGRVGTVVEVFRAPRDSCLVRIDGDPDRRREWFCYHDEVAASDQ